MRIHLIKKQSLESFAEKHPRSKAPFAFWLTAVKYADWQQPTDIQKTFGAADLLGKSSDRVVFDIGGNNFRLICKYHFGLSQVHLFVCWIGTHTAYTELCARNQQFTINAY